MNDPAFHASRAGSPFKARYGNFIGGRWVEPLAGRYFDNTTPITGQKITEIPRSQKEDIDLALDAAHAAKDAWGRTSAAERALILNRVANRMEQNTGRLALAETWGHGKPIPDGCVPRRCRAKQSARLANPAGQASSPWTCRPRLSLRPLPR